MADKPYSRIYHRLMSEFPTVWHSDAQLALFIRLLVAAEKFYPEWPTSNRRNGAYQSLLAVGLVIEREGTDGYTIRGLEAERERRSAPGRTAAAMRWQSGRNAGAYANAMLDETRRDKTRQEGENGQSPTTYMGWKPKQVPQPDRLPGEALVPRHEGQHPDCAICNSMKGTGSIEDQQAASLKEALEKHGMTS